MGRRVRSETFAGFAAACVVALASLAIASASIVSGCGDAGREPGIHFLPPLRVLFRHEDVHVIAFLEDHPEYEAVEAMIGMRAGREPLVRAILTRHDKTQVDHINDQAVVVVPAALASEE